MGLRRRELLNRGWQFYGHDGDCTAVDLPHTWNAADGQDGDNNYWRGSCRYTRTLPMPDFDPGTEVVYLEFCGVNASAEVRVNGRMAVRHDGGYATFRADITALLQPENTIEVIADNSVNDRVYPQKADFTFYGGIYRDVNLLIADRRHFALDDCGGPGFRLTPDAAAGTVRVESSHTGGPDARVEIEITDADGKTVAAGAGPDATLTVPDLRLWDGIKDPYLYTATLRLAGDGGTLDEVGGRFGFRSFSVDPKKGFLLNGRAYPLHGVSRHQDRKGRGNALSRADHEEDMALIREIGANTIRLAHYQHDQYFYDLCDRYGMIVWAEIPYISEHMPNGRENTVSQMKELITQNYNHPSIVVWGISNEITISTKDKKDMLDNHRVLNELCHTMDPTRLTTAACYAMCGPFNRSAHISDLISWNLYLGWYVPGLFLNDLWISFFHFCYPKRPLGYSEYGCEGMPDLHSSHPRRGDQTEEYQAVYHEFMLRCFARHPYLWATHVWNMFDFAADARDQGGEAGMNHKGLVTFDRKLKKDSFYLYKAYWSDEPFVHICGSRYLDRPEAKTTVKVYSNRPRVTLYVNGEAVAEGTGDKIFCFEVSLGAETKLEAVAGDCRDTATLRRVSDPNPAYKLHKTNGTSANWV